MFHEKLPAKFGLVVDPGHPSHDGALCLTFGSAKPGSIVSAARDLNSQSTPKGSGIGVLPSPTIQSDLALHAFLAGCCVYHKPANPKPSSWNHRQPIEARRAPTGCSRNGLRGRTSVV